MNKPTDPLPEPWEWYNYQGSCWGVAKNDSIDDIGEFLVWTFNPDREGFSGVYGDIPEGMDCWLVRTNNTHGETYVACFSTLEEATHYMAMRAMLGTWPEKEKE